MSDFIATENMEYDFISSSDSGDLSLNPDTPNEKVKIKGDKIYTIGSIPQVQNFENDSVNNGTGAGSFIPAIKVKAGGEFVIRENDTAILAGAGTNKNPPPPTLPFVSTIQIDDAKQTVVKAT